jgi:hypothetical protein
MQPVSKNEKENKEKESLVVIIILTWKLFLVTL